LLCLATVANASGPAGFVPLGESHSFASAPNIYGWRFENVRGDSPYDKIALHRVTVGAKPVDNPEIVVLYLPGTNMNGSSPRRRSSIRSRSTWRRTASDFWAMDYRTHFVPATAEQGDLKELKVGPTNCSRHRWAVKFVRIGPTAVRFFLPASAVA